MFVSAQISFVLFKEAASKKIELQLQRKFFIVYIINRTVTAGIVLVFCMTKSKKYPAAETNLPRGKLLLHRMGGVMPLDYVFPPLSGLPKPKLTDNA